MGPKLQLDAHHKCAKTSPKNVQRILARMAPKMADIMFSNLSTFQVLSIPTQVGEKKIPLTIIVECANLEGSVASRSFLLPLEVPISSSPSWSLHHLLGLSSPCFFSPVKPGTGWKNKFTSPKKCKMLFPTETKDWTEILRKKKSSQKYVRSNTCAFDSAQN